jgi:hypothetical protein
MNEGRIRMNGFETEVKRFFLMVKIGLLKVIMKTSVKKDLPTRK